MTEHESVPPQVVARIEAATERYNRFLRRHRDLIHEWYSLLIDKAEARLIQPATGEADVLLVNRVANVIGSSGDHNTRLLAALIVGAMRSPGIPIRAVAERLLGDANGNRPVAGD